MGTIRLSGRAAGAAGRMRNVQCANVWNFLHILFLYVFSVSQENQVSGNLGVDVNSNISIFTISSRNRTPKAYKTQGVSYGGTKKEKFLGPKMTRSERVESVGVQED